MALWGPTAATACVALGALGHLVAHGSAPGVIGLALAGALCWLLWSASTDRELGAVGVLWRVWLCQAFVHGSLVVGAASAPAHSSHAHSTTVTAPPLHLPHLLGQGGWGMFAMHALAGVAVAWWLRRGEALAWRVARRAIAHLTAALRTPDVVLLSAGPAAPICPARPALLVSQLALAGIGRRGPPPLGC